MHIKANLRKMYESLMQGIEPITVWLSVSLLLKPFALLYTDSDGERRLQKMCMKVYGI